MPVSKERVGLVRAAVCALILALLAGCGGAPSVPHAAVPTSSPSGAAFTVAPETSVGLPPSTTAAATAPANAPTAAQSPLAATATTLVDGGAGTSSGLSAPLRQGYSALAMLQGLTVVLGETAQQVQTGKLDAARVQDVQAATGGVLKSVRDVLAEPPPVDGMQTAWDEADRQAGQIQDIVSRWSANKLSPQQVEDQLKPLQEQGTHMLATADSALTQAFGVDPGALKQAREDALNSVRSALQATPTPH